MLAAIFPASDSGTRKAGHGGLGSRTLSAGQASNEESRVDADLLRGLACGKHRRRRASWNNLWLVLS